MCYDNKRPVCDPDECVLCDKCHDECPNEAFYPHEDPFTHEQMLLVDVEKCCSATCGGECWNVCPVCCLGEYPCPSSS